MSLETAIARATRIAWTHRQGSVDSLARLSSGLLGWFPESSGEGLNAAILSVDVLAGARMQVISDEPDAASGI